MHLFCYFIFTDSVYSVDRNKKLFTAGELGMIFPLKKLTEYYDVEDKKYKHQDLLDFELKIVCEGEGPEIDINSHVENTLHLDQNDSTDLVDTMTKLNLSSKGLH